MANLKLFIPVNEFIANVLNRSRRAGELDDISPFAVLPNIPGKRYTIGYTYPGEREDEEFIFYRYPNTGRNCWPDFVAPIQCQISVDDKGQFLISSKSEISKTFVNRNEVEEPRILKDEDSISFKIPRNYNETEKCPIMLVELKNTKTISSVSVSSCENGQMTNSSALDNDLILYLIFKYLGIQSLKCCRLVSKLWKQEASKLLEKKGTISFNFQGPWEIPNKSLRLFRYLNEPNTLKIQRLNISLPVNENLFGCPGSSEKFGHDFKKFLCFPNNFTSLTFNTAVTSRQGFSIFCSILEVFGENLAELKFDEHFEIEWLNEDLLSTSQLSFPKLKKLSDLATSYDDDNITAFRTWVTFLAPKISKTLEDFTCNDATAECYFKEFVKTQPTKLKHLKIDGGLSSSDIQNLLEIKGSHLATLTFGKLCITDEGTARRISKLLQKHADSLTQLQLELFTEGNPKFLLLPSLPNLIQFKFWFTSNIRIRLASGKIDYKLHFPVLKELMVQRFLELGEVFQQVGHGILSGNSSFAWDQEDSVFNTFFPDDNSVICTTVTNLVIPSLGKGKRVSGEEYRRFHARVLRIPDMFPKISISAREGLGLTQIDGACGGNREDESGEEVEEHFDQDFDNNSDGHSSEISESDGDDDMNPMNNLDEGRAIPVGINVPVQAQGQVRPNILERLHAMVDIHEQLRNVGRPPQVQDNDDNESVSSSGED